jgi:Tol biopolymer transport system component
MNRRVLNRLTFSPRSELSPLWIPDGRRLAIVVDDPPFNLHEVPVDGSAPPAAILQSPVDSYADAFSPDGRWLVVRQNRPDSASDLELQSLEDPTHVVTFRATQFDERFSTMSPDGRYLAYQSKLERLAGPGGAR